MIWRSGWTWEEKIKRSEKWHKWFAWYPVTYAISDEGQDMKVWLRVIYRQGDYWCGWKYRLER
jgi:hypothetical protein